MTRQCLIFSLWTLGFGVVLAIGPGGRTAQPSGAKAQEAADQQEGIEVLARGPVHEAFAEPAIRGPRPAAVTSKKPPQPIDELPPDQKPEGDNVQWIPGYWAWDDDSSEFLWVSGTYRAVPPNRQWVPGYWNGTADGWQWVGGFWADQKNSAIELLPAPPDAINEAVPAAPAAASIFEPGCWVYRDSRYLWRHGSWIPYRLGWVWMPASYVWTPGGSVFVEGYWDYPLRDRGLLFAPVNVDGRFRNRTDWSYRPAYVVHDDFLRGSLFARSSYNQYYFGDYFDPRYDRMGFVAWPDYRFGRGTVDPLFSYYRWQFKDDPGWVRDMRRLYSTRRADPAARPPRTLVRQGQVIRDITSKRITVTNVTNITNVTALAPLTKLDNGFVKLRPVSKGQRTDVQKTTAQFRAFSEQRGKLEAQAVKNGRPSAQRGESPGAIRMDLPKTRPAAVKTAEGGRAKAPPALPVMPTVGHGQQIKPGVGRREEGQPKVGGQEPKPVSGQPPGSQAKPAVRPEPQPAPKPAPKPVSGQPPGSQAKPAVRPEPQPGPKPEAAPKPQGKAPPERPKQPPSHQQPPPKKDR